MNTPLTILEYKTFTSLLEDVRVDLKGVANSGRIEPQQLIKTALRVNYDLGLRINKTQEQVLEVEHRKARLPIDFYVMNWALLCGELTVHQTLPQGTQIWEKDLVPAYKDWIDTPLCHTDTHRSHQWPESNKPVCLTKCDTGFQLIQKVNTQTRHYKYMLPIRFTNPRMTECNCPNLFYKCHDEAYIKDGFVFTNFECGNLYINYEGALVDDDGEILVPDQYGLNNYYEWALKTKILESLFMEGDDTIQSKLQYAQAQLKDARKTALSIVNMPGFLEMKQVYLANRRVFYNKYYEPLASYPWDQSYRTYGR